MRQVLLPLWNAYTFLTLYAPKVGIWRTDSANVLDRYILAKLAQLRDDLTAAPRRLRHLRGVRTPAPVHRGADQLVRATVAKPVLGGGRRRHRHLHTVLEVTSRLAALLLPMATEVIWRGITAGRSVHLTDWPTADLLPADPELVAAMDLAREVCSTGSSVRKAKKLRVRLPLPKLTVAVDNPDQLTPFTDLIADELNVKAVELTDDIAAYGRFELTVNAWEAGPRIGRDVQAAIKAVKAGEGVLNPDGTLTAGPAVLLPSEFSSKLVAAEPGGPRRCPTAPVWWCSTAPSRPNWRPRDGRRTASANSRSCARAPGWTSDRINVVMSVPDDGSPKADWARTHRDLIAGEILATGFEFGDPVDGTEIGDGVRVSVTRA